MSAASRSGSSLILLTAILSALAQGAQTAATTDAKALPTGGHANQQFVSAWDNDGDDKVSRDEYEAVRVDRFAKSDTDRNGALSVDEYVNEYATRLDVQIADERQASIKQTHTRFGALDQDKDSFVSRAEYDASGAKSFEHLDTDNDGRIVEPSSKQAAGEPRSETRRERRSVIGMPSSHNLAGFVEIYDADGDGTLTRDQYDAERVKVFAATDLNKDGKLDSTEYVNEFAARLDRQIADTRQAQLKQGKVRFKAIDDDKNSAISREEYFAMSARMFERADTNKDGVVSKDDPAPPRREGQRSAATRSADAAELRKIKVTAGEDTQSTLGNTTVVGVAQLEEEQAQNFEDAIRYIPGVSIVDMGRFGDNGFNIRGLEGDRVALTVDGLPFAESVETTPAYEFFRAGRGSVDIDSLKSIEVIKGADSITAGSGALGGAVMFTTKDPYDYLNADGNDSYFRVKTGYTSSSDELMTTATLANRTGMVESMVLYTRRRGHEAESWYDSSPVTTGSQRRTPDPIDRESDNVLAKVDFVLSEEHRFGLVGEYRRATNEIDNLSRVGGLGYLERRADDDSDRDRYGVRYLWQDAGVFFDSMEFTADRVETKSRGLTTILAGTGCAQNIVPCLRTEDRATDQVLDKGALDFTKAWQGGVSHSLIYGLAWQQRDVDFVAVDSRFIGTTSATSSVTVDPDQVPKTDVTNYSAYLRDSVFLLNDRLTLNGGVRYDRIEYSPRLDAQFVDDSTTIRDVDFAAASWQIGTDFKVADAHSIWAQVGRGFRAPSVGEMFAPTATTLATEVATGNEVVLWDSVANIDLEAEESLNTEIGYRWQSERHLFGISAYRDEYSNFIEDTSFIQNPDVAYQTCTGSGACTITNGNEYLMPTNAGEVVVKGVEVEGRWLINDQWSARLAWAYSEGEKKNGDPLPSIIPATGVLGVRYVSPSQLWTLTGNVTHADAKKLKDATITETFDFLESLAPDYLSDAYTFFDLFGEFNVTKDIRLSAGVYNAFNEKYYQWPRVRFVNEGTTTLYGYASGEGIGRFSEPGRNFRVSLAWQF